MSVSTPFVHCAKTNEKSAITAVPVFCQCCWTVQGWPCKRKQETSWELGHWGSSQRDCSFWKSALRAAGSKHILASKVWGALWENSKANKWCIFGWSNNLVENAHATIWSNPQGNLKKGLNSVCGLDIGFLWSFILRLDFALPDKFLRQTINPVSPLSADFERSMWYRVRTASACSGTDAQQSVWHKLSQLKMTETAAGQ